MDNDISDFLNTQTCATICVNDENGAPYCFTCFYAFDADKKVIYFKSSPGVYHVQLFGINKAIAGTVLPDKLKTLLVQGVQFRGTLLDKEHAMMEKSSTRYHKRHPLALAKSGEIWGIQLDNVKMTDSSKGFGTKIYWERSLGK